MQNQIYERITNQFIEALNKGIIPWRKPYLLNSNFITKKEYQGINSLITSCKEFACPFWATFKQASELGGKIKKGEKGTVIIYWQCKDRVVENDLGEEETKKGFFLKYSTIFNLEQTEGISWEKPIDEKKFVSAKALIDGYKNAPEVVSENQEKAFYNPLCDLINMPKIEKFVSREEYFSCYFHELIHSTGHLSRLDRPELCTNAYFGSHDYSKEELVAEIGAAFLCHEAGILSATAANSEAYIAGWAKALGNDPKMIMAAAGHAKKAALLIMNKNS